MRGGEKSYLLVWWFSAKIWEMNWRAKKREMERERVKCVTPGWPTNTCNVFITGENMINYTCGTWMPPFMTGPCIWWWSGGWYGMSMLVFVFSMCWKCCWWKLFVVGSSSICGLREMVSSAGDGWREPGVRLKNRWFIEHFMCIKIENKQRAKLWNFIFCLFQLKLKLGTICTGMQTHV